ncbi:MAG: MBL fold metallo-hydrolase [Desulfuromonadales bacterium]|nr:MBL fold metallo-hydrolase [Desulfuromonadales bacterium]
MRVCLLASGSRGNSTLIEADNTRLLIDAGLSGKETQRRLAHLDLCCDDLDAILVTHEHHDHVGGIGPLARRHQLPVYVDSRTCAALTRLGTIPHCCEFDAGDSFELHNLLISSFSTTHDAINPVGFTIDSREGKIGYATDLGIATRLIADRLQQCRVLVLEANHDEQMLIDGAYPWALKQRIRSRHGHLSNEQACLLLDDIGWPGLEALFLAHLSEDNNCSNLVSSLFAQFVRDKVYQTQVIVGCQSRISACFNDTGAIVTASETDQPFLNCRQDLIPRSLRG